MGAITRAIPAAPTARSLPSGADLRRGRVLARKIAEGISSEDAWAQICTDPVLGFRAWRGAPSIPAAAAMQLWDRWARRVGGEHLEAARATAQAVLSSSAASAASTVTGLISTVADPKADHIRLQASRVILEAVGAAGGTRSPAVSVSVAQVAQTVVGGSDMDLVERMQRSPEGRAALDALERWHAAEQAREEASRARQTAAEVS